MSFPFKLKSHPDKLLKDHLENVGKLSKAIITAKHVENKEFYSEIAYLIGIAHDFGKATEAFQKMLDNGEKTKKANHGFLSSLFGYYIVRGYLKRVEKLEDFWYVPAVAWIVINKHHGNIKNIREEISKLKDLSGLETTREQIEDISSNLYELKAIYNKLSELVNIDGFINTFNGKEDVDKFIREIYKSAKRLCTEKDIKYYFYILLFYSVLLDADKLDASGVERLPERIKNLSECIVDAYKEKKFGGVKRKIDEIREKAYREVDSQLSNLNLKEDRILSINLPTGAGKTLTGLSFALKLREKIEMEMEFTPKIIYSLPFLSIIDQNSEAIEDVLRVAGGYDDIPTNLFLKHHHLADIEYKEKKEEEKENELNIIEDINKALLLTEGWHSEIIITTFVQFFHSLITNRNRAARKFHNMLNSIIILDEVQSIPHRYWLLINKVLDYLAKNFSCWIILMTATQPFIFERGEIKSLVESKEEYFEPLDRVMFEFDPNEKEFSGFKEEIFNQILNEKDKDIMIVLNTINSCKEMYSYLKEELSAKHGLNSDKCLDSNGICDLPDLELINLSTHILPDFRLSRITRINQDKDKRKIIVTTQLIEAGVDVSVDIIYRDFAPLDCIIQTAGRCNRNDGGEKGLVNVVRVKDENNKAFCSYIYDRTLLDITREVIKEFGSMVSEKSFTRKAADKYYTLVVERVSKDKSEKVMNHIKKLDFSDISSEFGLIEEKLPAVSIFVEIDEKAESVRKKIEEIMKEKKGYERRRELLALRRDLNSYSLSIRGGNKIIDETKTYLPSIGEIEDFRYVSRKGLKNWYKYDTGFSLPERDVEMRII
jgi:CRISPR-associated endonuclease/helicase Cas3